MKRLLAPLLVTVALSMIALAVACGGGGDSKDSQVVRVDLGNWFVTPDSTQLNAGEVTFRAKHEEMGHNAHDATAAGAVHELVVARVQPDGSLKAVGSAGDIQPGKSKDLKLTLEPGEYELQCNLTDTVDGKKVSHYDEGMHVRVKVS